MSASIHPQKTPRRVVREGHAKSPNAPREHYCCRQPRCHHDATALLVLRNLCILCTAGLALKIKEESRNEGDLPEPPGRVDRSARQIPAKAPTKKYNQGGTRRDTAKARYVRSRTAHMGPIEGAKRRNRPKHQRITKHQGRDPSRFISLQKKHLVNDTLSTKKKRKVKAMISSSPKYQNMKHANSSMKMHTHRSSCSSSCQQRLTHTINSCLKIAPFSDANHRPSFQRPTPYQSPKDRNSLNGHVRYWSITRTHTNTIDSIVLNYWCKRYNVEVLPTGREPSRNKQ